MILSIVGIALEEVESKFIPINPTIIRVMRVMRIARGKIRCPILVKISTLLSIQRENAKTKYVHLLLKPNTFIYPGSGTNKRN